MILTLKSEDEALQDIKDFIVKITGITPDEIENDTNFRVWLGKDGGEWKAMGIDIDKVKYPDSYQYKAYVALLHNVMVMMADYGNFLMWVTSIGKI